MARTLNDVLAQTVPAPARTGRQVLGDLGAALSGDIHQRLEARRERQARGTGIAALLAHLAPVFAGIAGGPGAALDVAGLQEQLRRESASGEARAQAMGLLQQYAQQSPGDFRQRVLGFLATSAGAAAYANYPDFLDDLTQLAQLAAPPKRDIRRVGRQLVEVPAEGAPPGAPQRTGECARIGARS